MSENKITPEVIEALWVLRNTNLLSNKVERAFDALDNAGVFAAIDSATDCDVDPEPERVSKCVCPKKMDGWGHKAGCPGDPEPERVSKCTCPRSRVTFTTTLGNDMHTPNCATVTDGR